MADSLSPETEYIVGPAFAMHRGECGKESARMEVVVPVGNEVSDEAIALWGNDAFTCLECSNRIRAIPVRAG